MEVHGVYQQEKKRKDIDAFICAVSLYIAETLKSSIKDQNPPLPIIPFGIVMYGFVGQPFSKQLYTMFVLEFQTLTTIEKSTSICRLSYVHY